MAPRRKKSKSIDIRQDFEGYMVCIGASAGGLDALERFLRACPCDSNAAFVVIQHLSPDHKSMMGDLLERYTPMPVTVVEDDMPIAANHVYLIPPGTVMSVSPDHFHLTPKAPRGLSLPIDVFFSSMAETYQTRAIGIVLSGTGTDGTRGSVAINSCGGFLIAQSPDTAKFDGMPRSAISTGVVDAVLPPEAMPQRMLDHIRNVVSIAPAVSATQTSPDHPDNAADALTAILAILDRACGVDFNDYKQATVIRRIERRMQVRHVTELSSYLELLQSDPTEIAVLKREMLISVTRFFRDSDAFEKLYEEIICPLVEHQPLDTPIRVWSAGIATGEEVYTLAMLFIEAFDRYQRSPNLKIFATDIDQNCIDAAGTGQYPESAASELSLERLDRFFTKSKEDAFVIKNNLRQLVVFARHNLLSDPPFTKMDLVVCRNTLIYFNSSAQERVLRSLQYALRDGGFLFLGPSESLSSSSEGLVVVSAKHKIFLRVGASALPSPPRRVPHEAGGESLSGRGGKAKPQAPSLNISGLGASSLLKHYAPAALVVDSRHEILHLYGDAGSFLEPKEGIASLSLTKQLPDKLVPIASALLYKVARDKTSLISDYVTLDGPPGPTGTVRLAVHPIDNAGESIMTLLCFEKGVLRETVPPGGIDVDAETVARISVLEQELAATRESLQATIEELETANEELQATNEELMASNEELQSSNEELQSVNEEMSTVNSEFQEKMLILGRTNADLDGMAKAAGVATVFVDSEMRITRFTPDALHIFKLRDTDIGRRLDDISHRLDYPDLITDMEITLQSGRPKERETHAKKSGHVYLVRILPYVVPSTTLKGVVATFIDVTSFHDAQRLQTIVDALPEHIAVLDGTGAIVLVNAAWRRFAAANGDPTLKRCGIGTNYLEVCKQSDGGDRASSQAAYFGLKQVLEGSAPRFSLEYPCHSPTEQRWFIMNVAPASHSEFGAVVSHIDISSWHRETPTKT